MVRTKAIAQGHGALAVPRTARDFVHLISGLSLSEAYPQKQVLLFSFSRGGHRGAATVGSLFKFALRDWTMTITQAG